MATVSKFANANAVVSTGGWSSPTAAYADDGSYATAAPAKNTDITSDYGFPAFTTGDIPAGATINSVTVEIQDKSSVTNSVNASIGVQLNNNGTLLGSEQTQGMSLTDQLLTHQVTTGITQTDLQSANLVKARVRGHRAASNTAITWSLDYVKLTVDYTAVTTLVVADAVTATSAEAPALTQANTLAVANAASATSADSPSLTQANTLVVQDASVATAAESPTLEAGALTLVVDDAVVATTAESPSLTQANTLAVADAAVATTADNLSLAQANTLAVHDAAVATSAESLALVQANTLAVANSTAATSAESPVLSQASTLAVQDAAVATTAESLVLTQASTLTVADSAVATSAESPNLTQAHTLAVQDAAVSTSAENVDLASGLTLDVQDATSATSAASPGLVQANTLAVQDANAATAAETPALVQANVLAVADCAVVTTAASPTLVEGGAGTITLVVQDAVVATSAESPALMQANTLAVNDALTLTTSDAVVLVVPGDIVQQRSGPAGVVRALSGPSYFVDRSHFMRVILGNDYDFEYKIIKRSNRLPLVLDAGQHLYGYFAAATGGSAIDASLRVELLPLSGGRGFLGTVAGADVTAHLTASAGSTVIEVVEIPGGTLRREREVDVVAASS